MNINNHSQITNFKIFLPFLNEIGEFAQSVTLPGITLGIVEGFNNSMKSLGVGDSFTYSDLVISFIVDEKFDVFKKIYKEFYKTIHPTSGEYSNQDFTAGVEITDNLGKAVLKLEFYGCKLSDLSQITMASNSDDAELSLDLTLRFDEMKVIDLVNDDRLEKF